LNTPRRILPLIVYSQFAGTALWFAVNAVLPDLQTSIGVNISDTGIVTSATQLGFISGTLIFSLFALSDRFAAKNLFLVCSLLGALSNLLIYFTAYDLFSLLVLRFITGFFLTGIYPIGMKIASGWYQKNLGNAIGFLVGALVLGTAFPHLLRSMGSSFIWQDVIIYVSLIAASGGLVMYIFVPEGPYAASGGKFHITEILNIFRLKDFRSAAMGYFGHMWELYTFWALVPVMLIYYDDLYPTNLNIFLWSFLIIASGSIGCIGGGLLSERIGSSKVAFIQLLLSGICCLLSPLIFAAPVYLFLTSLVVWGIAAAGDSPQYSAIIARSVPKELVGTALTLIVSIGFSITILSLWFIYQFAGLLTIPCTLMLLFPGPLFGMIALKGILPVPNSK
jgi:predicted MFS family arabinose efflux permease